MVLYPEVQKQAQAEIDRVVGTDRLPDFTDEAALPYIGALVKEVFRWHPAVPLGANFICQRISTAANLRNGITADCVSYPASSGVR